MSKPSIWDDAFELLDQFNANRSESVEDDSHTSPEQLNDDKSEPGESEIAFRNITEEASPELQADVPDTINEKEVSLSNIEEKTDLKSSNRRNAKDLYYEAQNNLFRTFQLIKNNRDFPIDYVFSYATDMVSHIREEANTWMQLLYKIEKNAGDEVMHIVKHSLDTAIIATRIGIGLNMQNDIRIHVRRFRRFYYPFNAKS